MTPRKETQKIPLRDKPRQSRPPPEEIEEENKEIEAANERKLKAAKEKNIEIKRESVIIIEPQQAPPPIERRRPFPHSLGPFGIRQTGFNETSFLIVWDDIKDKGKGGMFHIEKPAFGKNTTLRILAGPIKDWPVVGQFSPAYPITLSDSEKKAALIPINSTYFVWAYPVAGVSVDVYKLPGIDPADSDLSFLMVGGYVYFNKENKICGVNTIIPSDKGLVFSAPKKWNHDFTSFLAKPGRFQPITIKPLHDCGARWYCWIRPDEPLVDDWGTSEKLCPNGGFVYLFHDNYYDAPKDQLAKDCYFDVLSGEEYVEELAKIQASIETYGN